MDHTLMGFLFFKTSTKFLKRRDIFFSFWWLISAVKFMSFFATFLSKHWFVVNCRNVLLFLWIWKPSLLISIIDQTVNLSKHVLEVFFFFANEVTVHFDWILTDLLCFMSGDVHEWLCQCCIDLLTVFRRGFDAQ